MVIVLRALSPLVSRSDRADWVEQWADWVTNESSALGRAQLIGNAAVDSVLRMVERGRRLELVGQVGLWLSDDAHRVRRSDRWWWNRGGRFSAVVRVAALVVTAWVLAALVDLQDAPFGWSWWQVVGGVVVLYWVAWAASEMVRTEIRDPERAVLWRRADQLLVTSMVGRSRAEALEEAARELAAEDDGDSMSDGREGHWWEAPGTKLVAAAGELREQTIERLAYRVWSLLERRATKLMAGTTAAAMASAALGAAQAGVGAVIVAAALEWPPAGEWLIGQGLTGGVGVIIAGWVALRAAASTAGFVLSWIGDYFGLVLSVATVELVWLAGAGRGYADEALAEWNRLPVEQRGTLLDPVKAVDWFGESGPVKWLNGLGPAEGSWVSWLTGSSFPLWFDAVAIVVAMATVRGVLARLLSAAQPRVLKTIEAGQQVVEGFIGGDCVYCFGTGDSSSHLPGVSPGVLDGGHCGPCLGTGKANRIPYSDWDPEPESHRLSCRRCGGEMTGACRPELHQTVGTIQRRPL
jgi:hypothetical protein